MQAGGCEKTVAFFEQLRGVNSRSVRPQADQQPTARVLIQCLKSEAEMGMKQSPQPVANHRTFADFAADDDGASATFSGHQAKLRTQKCWVPLHASEHHPTTVVALGGAMEPAETALPPQAHGCGQCHQTVLVA